MKEPSPCEKCGLRRTQYVLLQDGTRFHVCDLCYWGRAESEDQETPREFAPEETARSLPAAA